MRATTLAALALVLVLPIFASATPVPPSVYRVAGVHADWGAAYGYLWGEPGQGGRMWLDTLGGRGEWGFTLGGSQERYPLPDGELVVDNWISPGGGRFVGTYVDDVDPPAGNVTYIAAAGGGRLAGWAITVYGHTR